MRRWAGCDSLDPAQDGSVNSEHHGQIFCRPLCTQRSILVNGNTTTTKDTTGDTPLHTELHTTQHCVTQRSPQGGVLLIKVVY